MRRKNGIWFYQGEDLPCPVIPFKMRIVEGVLKGGIL